MSDSEVGMAGLQDSDIDNDLASVAPSFSSIGQSLALGSAAGGASRASDDMIDESSASEPEGGLECFGCNVTSAEADPIAKRLVKKSGGGMKHVSKVKWARTSKRKVAGTDLRRKVKCGAWCLTCANVIRIRFKDTLKKLGGLNKFKKYLASNPKDHEKLRNAVKGYIKIRSGGKARVTSDALAVKVTASTEAYDELEDPETQFLTIKAYKQKFNVDPRTLKLPVYKRVTRSGKEILGLDVQVGESGVYKLKRGLRTSAKREDQADHGEEILDDEQVDDVFKEQRDKAQISKTKNKTNNIITLNRSCGTLIQRETICKSRQQHKSSQQSIYVQAAQPFCRQHKIHNNKHMKPCETDTKHIAHQST